MKEKGALKWGTLVSDPTVQILNRATGAEVRLDLIDRKANCERWVFFIIGEAQKCSYYYFFDYSF